MSDLPERISLREVGLVHMVEDMGVATGVDLDAIIDVAAGAERMIGHTLPSQVLRAGPRSRTISA